MKTSLSIAVLLLCFTTSAQNTSDSIAIMNLMANDYATYETLDIEAHRKNCTDEYRLIENGEILDFEKEAAYMRSLKLKSLRKNEFDKVFVKINGDFAYVVYELRSAITRNGTTKNYEWAESVVLAQKNGAWKIALIHSTKRKEW